MTNQNPLFINSYFSSLLHYHNFNPNIADFNKAWLQTWLFFRNSKLFGKSIPVSHPQGLFNTIIKNRQAVSATIATRTVVGTTLVLTFTDPTYNNFRPQQKVTDDSMKEGYVQSSAPGTITISPLSNPTVFVAANFPVANVVIAHGKLAGSYNSVGTIPLYEDKDNQQDYCEITRETYQSARREKVNLFASSVNGEQKIYGYTEGEVDTVNRFLKYCAFKYMFGVGGIVQTQEGEASKTWGIRDRIRLNSGNYLNGPGQITKVIFDSMLSASANASAGFQQEITILPGRRALGQIASFYPLAFGALGATQIENGLLTINGDIRNINVNGLNVKIVLDFAFLNDGVDVPDWHQDSVYFLNTSNAVYDGRTGKMIQMIHMSDDPNSSETVLYRVIPGMTSRGIGNTIGGGTDGMYQITGSSVDGVACEMEDDSGLAMLAVGQGLYEYIH